MVRSQASIYARNVATVASSRALEPSSAVFQRRRAVASFPPALPENPYQSLLYGGLADLGIPLVAGNHFKFRWLLQARRDVGSLHFHWPENYYRQWFGRKPARIVLAIPKLVAFGLRLRFARVLGYRVVWTVHEVLPHDSPSPRIDRAGNRRLAHVADALIVHDDATAQAVRNAFPGSAQKLSLVHHGSYVGVYPPGRSRSEVRRALGLAEDEFVFLTFGHVRRYKGIEFVLDAFRRTSDQSFRLLIVGLPIDDDVAAAVQQAEQVDPRVRGVLEFVPDDRVAELFAAADVAVLPRSDGGTSGALILALSLGKAVVTARTAVAADVAGEAAWFFSPNDPDELAAALIDSASDADDLRARSVEASLRAETLSWSAAATLTARILLPVEAAR